MKFTTVSVSVETKEKLRILGNSGDSIDKIIRRLIENENLQHRKDDNNPGGAGGDAGVEKAEAGGVGVDG